MNFFHKGYWSLCAVNKKVYDLQKAIEFFEQSANEGFEDGIWMTRVLKGRKNNDLCSLFTNIKNDRRALFFAGMTTWDSSFKKFCMEKSRTMKYPYAIGFSDDESHLKEAYLLNDPQGAYKYPLFYVYSNKHREVIVKKSANMGWVEALTSMACNDRIIKSRCKWISILYKEHNINYMEYVYYTKNMNDCDKWFIGQMLYSTNYSDTEFDEDFAALYKDRSNNARNCVMYFMLICKYVFKRIPKDVYLIIVKDVWLDQMNY